MAKGLMTYVTVGSSKSIGKDAAQWSVLTRRRALLVFRRSIYTCTDRADHDYLVLRLLSNLMARYLSLWRKLKKRKPKKLKKPKIPPHQDKVISHKYFIKSHKTTYRYAVSWDLMKYLWWLCLGGGSLSTYFTMFKWLKASQKSQAHEAQQQAV